MHKNKFVHPVAQAVHRRSLTSEKWIHSQFSLRGIFGGKSDTGTDFFPEHLVLFLSVLFQQYSMLVCWSSTLYNLITWQRHGITLK